MTFARLLAVIAVSSLISSQLVAEEKPDKNGINFFEKKIRPVLVKHCYECHSGNDPDAIEGELRVDLRAGLREGGETGPAVVPKDIDESLLINAIEYDGFEMPPDEQLAPEVIADFKKWIRMGAPDPRDGKVEQTKRDPAAEFEHRKAELWSLKPIEPPAPPKVADADKTLTAIDRFVEAKRQERGLSAVAPADAMSLLRRLSFDLVGLPPTLDQQTRFASDFKRDRQSAVLKMTDELLKSRHYGERWGRHWLDVVRYAESTGNSRDVLTPEAWRYRNYVIDAINDDVPFDRFVTEQIAGDLLPAESVEERDRLRIATGLLAIGSKSLNGGNLALDIADDQIDVVSKSMLGLTVSCARCHDHKFDPIPTADYYAMVGIFRSTTTLYGGGTGRPKNDLARAKILHVLGETSAEELKAATAADAKVSKLNKQVAAQQKKNAAIAKRLPKDWQAQRNSLRQQIADAQASTDEINEGKDPRSVLTAKDRKQLALIEEFEAAQKQLREMRASVELLRKQTRIDLDFAMGVREAPKPVDSPIQIRGEARQRGEVVRRGFLTAVDLSSVPEIPSSASGRRELASWITQPDHPLTSRVIVNRVWQHLFGRGLVESVDNFGLTGDLPSHPELLDHLASSFVYEHNWSIKSLIRQIVQTRTYQLSSEFVEANAESDPANIFLWRASRRRLEAEPIRDALLAVSGTLDRNRPAESLVRAMGEGEVGRGIKTEVLDKPFPHRSVYLPVIRGIIPEFLRLFDLPEPSNPQGLRDVTNVPSQSLWLINSPFVLENADALATRLLDESESNSDRIQMAYRLCFTRDPSANELNQAERFIEAIAPQVRTKTMSASDAEHAAWSAFAQALFAGAEFRYLR